MKNLIVVLVLILSLLSCKNKSKQIDKSEHDNHVVPEKMEEPKKKPLSPHTSAMAMIGDAHVHIDYSSPGVRGRIIFGGLVGYDNVWQAGAHNATWIETNKDVVINDQVLPKGKYGFFTIPSKADWTVMINKNWDQHGKDEYNEKDDVIRFNVTPQISEEITEQLVYKVEKTNETKGVISLAWEKVTISFPFKIKH
ncbi:MAG: hypothetical protein ACJAZK_001217 [Psychroserpens sp.]|jgi:hypothetical protein|uniref:DUF2911 domain-containing protein n=1 Tax=Psychroserpens sp. TaxID=2020870 RepID=UPI0039E67EB9